MRRHVAFWRDLAGRIGPPIFAATLVACLLERGLDPLHIVLLVAGVGLTGLGHRSDYHEAG